MQRACLLVAGVALIVRSSTAFGWGHQGHEVVGAIADKMLSSNSATKVRSILGLELREAAKWPDCVRDVVRKTDGTFKYMPNPKFHLPCVAFETPEGIARMEDYVRRNWDACHPGPQDEPCHKQYHFDD